MSIAFRRIGLALLGATVLPAACSYTGGDIGNPLVRSLDWFSYVAGDDIRAHCDAGSPDRFRLVYNAVWGKQVRMYDLDGVRRVLAARVTRPGQMQLDAGNPLASWQAAEGRTPLDNATYDGLLSAFAAGGMFAPPPVGLDLPSRSYFWTAAYCRDGHYGFTAWKYPSSTFASLTFDRALFALDTTGVAPRPAGPVPLDPDWESLARYGREVQFTLTVGRSGLVR